MGDMLESEAEMVTSRLQPRRTIDQKGRVRNGIFLVEFREDHLGQPGGSGREQSDNSKRFVVGSTAAYSW